jgi:DnaJ-domain-containing protein 1
VRRCILVNVDEQRRRIERSRSLVDALDTLKAERKRVEAALEKAALRREKALEEAAAELERIGDLAMDAIDAGSTATDVCRIGGVSRRTLYKMLDERGYARHRDS